MLLLVLGLICLAVALLMLFLTWEAREDERRHQEHVEPPQPTFGNRPLRAWEPRRLDDERVDRRGS